MLAGAIAAPLTLYAASPRAAAGSPASSPGAGSAGTQTGLPQPAVPAPSRVFFSYTPDGAQRRSGGVPANPLFRPQIINVLPQLSAYGFKRYMTVSYLGVTISPSACNGYFGPLADAAEQNGMQYIPGLWLHDIVALTCGYAEDPPWNVTEQYPYLYHPMTPEALLAGDALTQNFWNIFVAQARMLAIAARSSQVLVECESVFWQHQNDPFWTDANIAAIGVHFRSAVQQLWNDGITLATYHPAVQPTTPNMVRIANGIYRPTGPNDVLHSIEHLTPFPYFRATPWGVLDVPTINGYYTSNGFPIGVIRYGFISNHAGSQGFSPAQYHEYCLAQPGIIPETWFFSGTAKFQQHAAEFALLATGEVQAGTMGDMNADSKVDGEDVRLWVSVQTGDITDQYMRDRADITHDGVIDENDRGNLIEYLLRY